ncbi:GNAT family N-acetyltransferase [Agromyces sp. MMS24-K17]|uniref:GNAT family N-acetyltransferase n=1 Tax=Agromyces sp. MMS24-K17 TaxID=3372850 RepID=UPI003753FAD9
MSDSGTTRRIEYPDAAGYPDGAGTLDEGTLALVDEVTAAAIHQVDVPSTDADLEISVHHRVAELRYTAVLGDREIGSIRYDLAGDRVVVLTTMVDPDFRGRGIAGDLIADVLDDIRDRGLLVTARCPVVAAFLAGNSQYADLAG